MAEFGQTADPPIWFQYSDHLSLFVALDSLREGLFEVAGYGTQYSELVVPLFLYSMVVVILFTDGIGVIGERRFDQSELE